MKTQTTPAEVLDLVEYSINEVKPEIKTARGVGSDMEIKIGRRKFTVSVQRKKRAASK